MSESFQVLRPSSIRASSRLACSSGLTSSQYFNRSTPDSTMAFSNPGITSRKCLACSSVQNPSTRSTPARLYQLRSKITTSPAAGKCGTYRWAYICDFSRSVGAGSATTRKMRGLTRSVMALIVPPLPAPSRPSKIMQTLRPLCTTHCWSLTNSTCKRVSSRSYSFLFSLPLLSLSSGFVLDIGLLMASILRYRYAGADRLGGDPVQMYQNAAMLAVFLLIYSAIAGRIERSWISGPIVFTAVGFILGPDGLGVMHINIGGEGLRLLAELTLAMVLFTDAANADFSVVRRNLGFPERLLLIGLPLTILLGFFLAAIVFPSLETMEIALLAAMLAPTDA